VPSRDDTVAPRHSNLFVLVPSWAWKTVPSSAPLPRLILDDIARHRHAPAPDRRRLLRRGLRVTLQQRVARSAWPIPCRRRRPAPAPSSSLDGLAFPAPTPPGIGVQVIGSEVTARWQADAGDDGLLATSSLSAPLRPGRTGPVGAAFQGGRLADPLTHRDRTTNFLLPANILLPGVNDYFAPRST
jgi:hypothetical protein